MADRIELVDLTRLHAEMAGELTGAIRRVCEQSAFIGGSEVSMFEQEWAQFVGARHAVGVGNGTDAIQLALTAAGLPAGSPVAVPANTFIATAEGVAAAGHSVRFVDVDAQTGLINLSELAQVLEDGVRAVVVVHLYGRMVDMDHVMALARSKNVVVIEDAAQAHDARHSGRHAGTFGDAGTFSFYPGKNLGAFGDAGAVVTNDDELAAKVRLLRDHGRSGRDNHTVLGVNSRLDALQAAILRTKLPHLKQWTRARRAVAETYRRNLPAGLLDWSGADDPAAESHHLFPILVAHRDEVAERLQKAGIATGVHYRVPCPCTAAFGCRRGSFPVAEDRAARQLSLPMHPHLLPSELERIVAEVTTCSSA